MLRRTSKLGHVLILALTAGLAMGGCAYNVDRTRDDPHPEILNRAQHGDVDAMYRVALSYETSDPRNNAEMVGWLMFASLDGHGKASYKLALHYLSIGSYTQAVQYKKLARAQGYYGQLALRRTR